MGHNRAGDRRRARLKRRQRHEARLVAKAEGQGDKAKQGEKKETK